MRKILFLFFIQWRTQASTEIGSRHVRDKVISTDAPVTVSVRSDTCVFLHHIRTDRNGARSVTGGEIQCCDASVTHPLPRAPLNHHHQLLSFLGCSFTQLMNSRSLSLPALLLTRSIREQNKSSRSHDIYKIFISTTRDGVSVCDCQLPMTP